MNPYNTSDYRISSDNPGPIPGPSPTPWNMSNPFGTDLIRQRGGSMLTNSSKQIDDTVRNDVGRPTTYINFFRSLLVC